MRFQFRAGLYRDIARHRSRIVRIAGIGVSFVRKFAELRNDDVVTAGHLKPLRIGDAAHELLVGQLERGRHQIAHVDLAGTGEDDAVAIDEVDRTVCLDPALDLRWSRLGIVYTVQRDPLVATTAHIGTGALIEVHRRVLANVERLPIQDCFLGGLFDIDGGPAILGSLHRRLGVEPARRERVGVDLETTFGQTVRN
ncbi:hypothetical protein GCM10007205_00910 [Oxalicibacterium flavum]|uniref:Uncharacterized protein n=1 Tax=Oxalicibacterium flavum TaxID=179467 RepID=A0A8J2XWZ8_9BURK|nr:hypothetical protein GCM10007205_00910 [Oxalicibacterium flavum]